MLNHEKDNLIILEKLCDIFTSPFPIASLVLWHSWKWQSMLPLCDPGTWFQKKRNRHFFQRIVFIYFLPCMKTTWRTDERHLSFSCLTQNSLKAEKQWHSSKTIWGKEIINSCLGQKIKIIAKKTQNAEILDRKARMRLSLGNFAVQKCLYLLGNLERNAHA